MIIDPKDLDKSATYALMTSVIVPRPIAWVGTRGLDGVDNLAPFSYFMGVSSDPPLLAISVSRARGGGLKDTARNLLDTEVCTISLVSEELLGPMHQSSAPYPPEVSEFDAVGLERVMGELVAAPRVASARAAMELRLHSFQDLASTHLFVLQVLRFYLPEVPLIKGKIPASALAPVARLSNAYASLGEEHSLPPPRVS